MMGPLHSAADGLRSRESCLPGGDDMMIRGRILVSAVAAFAMAAAPRAQSEKKVEMKDLPPAVQKAVQEQTKGLTLKGLASEVEDGKTFYEAETTVNGHAKDFLFDAAGHLVEI